MHRCKVMMAMTLCMKMLAKHVLWVKKIQIWMMSFMDVLNQIKIKLFLTKFVLKYSAKTFLQLFFNWKLFFKVSFKSRLDLVQWPRDTKLLMEQLSTQPDQSFLMLNHFSVISYWVFFFLQFLHRNTLQWNAEIQTFKIWIMPKSEWLLVRFPAVRSSVASIGCFI